jgi:hypothetical protein
MKTRVMADLVSPVVPSGVSANGLVNPFTRNKRFRLTCGACGVMFDHKFNVDTASDPVMSVCPTCGIRNQWSLARWAALYEERLRHG